MHREPVRLQWHKRVMPTSPLTFKRFRALHGPKQALLQCRLIGPTGQQSVFVVTLLDTGAEYSVLNDAVATSVGYVVSSLPTLTITLANGTRVAMRYLANAIMEVEGKRVNVSRLLLTTVGVTPLLCPSDMISATEFAFDANNFYFD